MNNSKLLVAQQAMKANDGHTPAELIWVKQLEPAVLRAIKDSKIAGELTVALPVAIAHAAGVITDAQSTPEQRTQAGNTLFWLYNITLASLNSTARSNARRAEATARAAKYHSIKATATIRIAAEKKKIKLKLARALKAVQEQATQGGINA